MSFTSEIKKELTSQKASRGTLLALIRMNGALGISGGLTLSLSTENAATAKYIYQMLLEIYQIYTANSHFFGVGPGTDLV